MAMEGGIDYGTARNLPLEELNIVIDEANEVLRKRKQEMARANRNG